MRICILDGEKITDKDQLHDILAASLKLPDWYGRNLDALHDCLTDIQEETELQLLQMPLLETKLGRYATLLVKVLQDAEKENPFMQLKIDDKMDEE